VHKINDLPLNNQLLIRRKKLMEKVESAQDLEFTFFR